MTEWVVHVEAHAEPDMEVDDDEVYTGVVDLMELLADYDAVTAGDGRTWSVDLTIEDDWGPGGTAARATELAVTYAEKAGLPLWPIVRCEVVRADLVDVEQAVPNFPDLVGAQEVTDLLNVSRQRLHELRASGRFPEPMVTLASGPVWLRPAVEAFLESWNRRPGRPKSTKIAYYQSTDNGWIVTVPGWPGSFHYVGQDPPPLEALADWIKERGRDIDSIELHPWAPGIEL